jgi:hypothetical protein
MRAISPSRDGGRSDLPRPRRHFKGKSTGCHSIRKRASVCRSLRAGHFGLRAHVEETDAQGSDDSLERCAVRTRPWHAQGV